MKPGGIMVWCCMVDGCEYVANTSGMCPAHRTLLGPLILVPKKSAEARP